ncbi:hypothetical protein [Methylobacillus methanolivorans]
MKDSNKNKVWSALAVVMLSTALAQGVAYAHPDDRPDRGPRHEHRWDKGQERGHAERGPRGGKGWDRGGHPVMVQQNVYYQFRDQDRMRLYNQYQRSFRNAHWGRRPDFRPGYVVMPAYRPYITPVPVHVLRTLPPPPPGYVIGYYQGYNVVYDPTTYVILTAIDLLSRR